MDENNNTDGEQKIYPPIDDFSDDDAGMSPFSQNLRAKVSFGKNVMELSNGDNGLQNSGAANGSEGSGLKIMKN